MKNFKDWMPIRIYWQQLQPMVDWCHLGQRRLTDPFFEETVNACVRHPADLLFRHQTPLEYLGELASVQPGLPPSGFIFHMSRCGSTLMSQMLAALPRNIVISEAAPIDEILRLCPKSEASDPRTIWLRWLISALGQQRHPEQKHLFIKFDCWHALFLPLIRKAFPGVPWVFAYREPVEVLVSHSNHRGAQMIPGVLDSGLFGWGAAYLQQVSLEEYGAKVLAKICETALSESGNGTSKLINYRQLPAVWPALMREWKLDFSSLEFDQMLNAAKLNAKNPFLPFEDDTQVKNKAATNEIREVSRRWLEPIYQRLEERRQNMGLM